VESTPFGPSYVSVLLKEMKQTNAFIMTENNLLENAGKRKRMQWILYYHSPPVPVKTPKHPFKSMFHVAPFLVNSGKFWQQAYPNVPLRTLKYPNVPEGALAYPCILLQTLNAFNILRHTQMGKYPFWAIVYSGFCKQLK
jgi:hypothetical protein